MDGATHQREVRFRNRAACFAIILSLLSAVDGLEALSPAHASGRAVWWSNVARMEA